MANFDLLEDKDFCEIFLTQESRKQDYVSWKKRKIFDKFMTRSIRIFLMERMKTGKFD